MRLTAGTGARRDSVSSTVGMIIGGTRGSLRQHSRLASQCVPRRGAACSRVVRASLTQQSLERGAVPSDIRFPAGSDDDTELLLQWLGYLRGAVLRNVEGIEDAQARWTHDGKLLPLLGIVNHLTRVEWRWIDGG